MKYPVGILVAVAMGWATFAGACSLEEKKASGFAQPANFAAAGSFGGGADAAAVAPRPGNTGVGQAEGGTSSNFDDGVFNVGKPDFSEEPSRRPTAQ